MNILVVTPTPLRSRTGNRVTASRWAKHLRKLGHHVEIRRRLADAERTPEMLIALHAHKSAGSVTAFPSDRPLVVALTGTDVYGSLSAPGAAASLDRADRLILLQERARRELPRRHERKARVILQSARPLTRRERRARRTFDVLVVGNLRPVKDPFRTALASRDLPAESRIRVLQVGAALSAAADSRARHLAETLPRYRWLGEQPRKRVRQLMGRSRLLVVSSRSEGGANVVSEALVAGLPILASRVPGNVGLLGRDYPGYFASGATGELSRLLTRCENQPDFLTGLRRRGRALAPRFEPRRERHAWKQLLEELT